MNSAGTAESRPKPATAQLPKQGYCDSDSSWAVAEAVEINWAVPVAYCARNSYATASLFAASAQAARPDHGIPAANFMRNCTRNCDAKAYATVYAIATLFAASARAARPICGLSLGTTHLVGDRVARARD